VIFNLVIPPLLQVKHCMKKVLTILWALFLHLLFLKLNPQAKRERHVH